MNSTQMGARELPQLGQGTWNMGDDPAARKSEIEALRRGIELGMTVIDTAEMYGSGRSEELVGEAVRGLRERVYLVSKVLPSNASRDGVVRACERSLKRLAVATLDLYLLHWRGRHPLEETVAGFEQLVEQGTIKAWGVSNFDVSDMEELAAVSGGCAANQVLYNPEHRGIEFDLLPWSRERSICVMAYSPVGQGGSLLRSAALKQIANRHGATPAQVALAWCMREPVLAIPKAGTVEHVQENAEAAGLKLTEEDYAELDRAYPPPTRKQRLAML